ncbi:MAG: alanine--tRNA ligase [Terriglobales bacterium]
MMSGDEIRQRFLDFFERRGHKVVPSSPLVPQRDPTLLFTNAGMNQFKDVFLGIEQRNYSRAASAQRCLRAGGKHNDLENVGFTRRHHTFFEMLGNFSFGDYFKDEAIALAWELLTSADGFGLDRGRLFATVFTEDEQAERIWLQKIGLNRERVFRLGAEDNFWAMGETGPCGPCSELHYDLGAGASEAGHEACAFPCECGRYVEIWNLVFMQFERNGGGELTPLPRPSIDTGAGLERLTAVLQGKISNYDTDLFQPIIAVASGLAGARYGENAERDISLRILADHARAATFLVHDGMLPGNEGRGYVLRKIIRRGLRHGRLLGIEDTFFPVLANAVVERMQGAYPELNDSRERVARVLGGEEERFNQTMAVALRELEPELARLGPGGQLAGEEMFRLYDTFGLPLDLLQEMARERNFLLDVEGFAAALERQRQRARQSWRGGEQASAAAVYRELAGGAKSEFVGYEQTVAENSAIVALVYDGKPITTAEAGMELEAVLDRTPFYAASGGQIGDQGQWMTASGVAADVMDTSAPVSGLTVHRVRARQVLKVGERVEAIVTPARRQATRRNHTATHLLQAALRQVLGPHVKQAGSVVEPGRLRFDFTHFAPLSSGQIVEIERLVNGEILANIPVQTESLPLEEAVATGAMALFGEKYQSRVRVVSVAGFSKELCGGTHCQRTGDIGLFKVVYESSVASGVRRIEAVTGEGAYERFQQSSEQLHQLSGLLRAPEQELAAGVGRLLEQQRKLQDENLQLRMRSAQQQAGAGLAQRRREIGGVSVVTARMDGLERAQLRSIADEMRRRVGEGVVAVGNVESGKGAIVVATTAGVASRLGAGAILKALPGVRGGGRAELAEGGTADAAALEAALEGVYDVVEKLLDRTIASKSQ